MVNNKCYFCESTKDIEKHHIVPQRFGGSDDPTNIVELCHNCHWKLERLYNKEFWESIGFEDPRTTTGSHKECLINDCSERAVGTFYIGSYTDKNSDMKQDQRSLDKNPYCDIHLKPDEAGPYGLPSYEYWNQIENPVCDEHETFLIWLTRDNDTEINTNTGGYDIDILDERTEYPSINDDRPECYQNNIEPSESYYVFEGHRLKITCPETDEHIISVQVHEKLTYDERRKTVKRIASNIQSLLHE